ncbi:MAG: SoxR reducing system RseC family protein [Paludibacter sp.]|nr:SoxR reducing system RseC family protein [Paludibacter sp.]
MAHIIEHNGVINEINNDRIHVLIIQQTACSECHASGVCTSADKETKIIEVESSDPDFKIGENVILYGKQSIGLQAVLLAFVIPFILVLVSLIIQQSFVTNEAIAGVVSLLVLVPYYLILSFFNKRLKAKFKFEIRKDTNT